MTNENSKYKIMINNDTDTIFIQLTDEKYKKYVAKVGHIEWTENNDIDFDMEVPEGNEFLYEDDDFCTEIQKVVGDIVAKSVNTYWNEAEKQILTDLNSKVEKVMSQFNIKLEDGKSMIETFADKGYVISEDDKNRVTAIKPETEEIYHFDNRDDLQFLRQEITGSKLFL